MANATPILLNEYKGVEDLYEAIHDVKEDETALEELQDFWKNGLGTSCSPYKVLTKTEEGEVCGETAAILSKQLAMIRADIQVGLSLDDFSVSYYDESRVREWYNRLDIKEESVSGR